jgi:hypothetical protein
MHRFQRWRQILQEAHTEEAIVSVMRDYVATLTPEVVSLFPENCQQALRDPDIQSAAVALLQCELSFKGPETITGVLHEIAHTYAAASTRLTAIKREVTPGD